MYSHGTITYLVTEEEEKEKSPAAELQSKPWKLADMEGVVFPT